MVTLQQNFMPLQSDINTNQNLMALFYKFSAQDIYNEITNADAKLSPLGPALTNIAKNFKAASDAPLVGD